MKCTRAKRYILLASTGELSDRGKRRLHDHLSSCPTCRAYDAEIRAILSATSTALRSQLTDTRVAELSTPETMNEIRRTAEDALRHRTIAFPSSAPRLAFAAAAVLALAVLLFWDSNGHADRIRQASALVAMVHQAEGVAEPDSREQQEEAEMNQAGLERLANDLLQMEGMEADDTSGWEIFTSDDEPSATTLPFRSTRVAPVRRYV